MKRIFLIIIIFFTVFHLLAMGKHEEDKYVGMTLEKIINKLGSPDSESMKTIDKDYVGYESEPDYSKHFPEIQLSMSIIVKIISYEKPREKIIIWLKNIDNNWIVFSSIKFNPNKYVY